ncbi:MAG: CidA/LrgA family protein, partial [Propioniciclava sp.]|nr:CidA/LrgA family protein [Propioniciclava sp.]
MIGGLALLLAFQLVGELVVRLTGLPIPGPVIGMVLCFGWLRWHHPREGAPSVRAADVLVRYLPI